MEKKYLAINCAMCFWLLALIAWFSDEIALARLAAACTLFAFLIHTQREKINAMFMKKNKTEAQAAEVAAPAVAATEPETASVKKQETTVIASGHVYIHGQVTGNIEAKEHLIKVMREGQVEGNISCRELIVDGKVHGQCRGDSIAIEEHGNIDGTLAYRALAIKKGGLFTGSAEVLAAAESKNKSNIVGLIPEEGTKPVKSQHA
ncbi:TPA: polymer-forming cytoskeletal protein [Klebsiella aerogenes]